MKRIFAIWIILVTLAGCNQSTENQEKNQGETQSETQAETDSDLTVSGRPPFSGELKDDLKNLGMKGIIPVQALGVTAPQELYKLQSKMGKYLAKFPNTPRPANIKELNIDTISSYPYIGLSQQEWIDYKRMMEEVAYSPLANGSLSFADEGETFLIKPESDNFKPWWDIKIDIPGNKLLVQGLELPYVGVKSDDAPTNGFGPWQWHEWSIEEKNPDADPQKPETMTAKNLKFQFGQVEKNGKTVLFLTLQEIEKGKPGENYVVPLWF